jgi:hypothetical protein
MLAANVHSGKNDEDKLDALLASLRTSEVDPVLAMLAALPESTDLDPANINPVDADTQSRLDQKKLCACPQCGHEFRP